MILQKINDYFPFNIFLQPYFHLIFFILLSGCKFSEKEEINENLYTINVEAIIDSKQKVNLSEIASNITYVPLETQNDNLFSNIRNIGLTDSYIFVSEENKLLQFTTYGKFVKQIGKFGRGPGEYMSIMYFAVNEKANIILIQDEHQNNKYDIDGNFLEKINLPSIHYLIYSPSRIAFYLTNYVGKINNLVITDNNLITLYEFQNQNARPETKLKFGSPPLYVFKNNLYFKENYNDTVFCVKDSLLIPHIIYNEKNLLIDKNFDLHSTGDVLDLIKQLEKVENKIMIEHILESNRYVFTSYIKGLDPRNTNHIRILFDKKINEAYVISEGVFINNIDGGPNIWINTIKNDNTILSWINAYELKAHVDSEAFKNSIPKYPDKKKELEKLANSLDENDNPVLMLVKLKE